MDRLGNVVLALILLGVGLPTLVIGVLFAWRMLSPDDYEIAFTSPDERFVLEIREDCLFGPCYKYVSLRIASGGLLSTAEEMNCTLKGADTSRVIFRHAPKLDWAPSGRTVAWRAGDPPSSGVLDLARDCAHQTELSHRTSLRTLRFRENCAFTPCVREVFLVQPVERYKHVTPCRVEVTSDRRVFVGKRDPGSNVSVEFDAGATRARWTSAETGLSGVIEFAKDCDFAKTRKVEDWSS